jgi:hypothetical protein
MFKLKLKKGETATIKKRNGFILKLIGGNDYDQNTLEFVHSHGFTNLVAKIKHKDKEVEIDLTIKKD